MNKGQTVLERIYLNIVPGIMQSGKGGASPGQDDCEVLIVVTLSEAKGLAARLQILRCAQNDRLPRRLCNRHGHQGYSIIGERVPLSVLWARLLTSKHCLQQGFHPHPFGKLRAGSNPPPQWEGINE